MLGSVGSLCLPLTSALLSVVSHKFKACFPWYQYHVLVWELLIFKSCILAFSAISLLGSFHLDSFENRANCGVFREHYIAFVTKTKSYPLRKTIQHILENSCSRLFLQIVLMLTFLGYLSKLGTILIVQVKILNKLNLVFP